MRWACALLMLAASAAAKEENPYAALLESRGIRPTRNGLEHFLRQFVPDAKTPGRVDALVEDLFGADPMLRELAARRLGRIPFMSGRAVREAFEGTDPEVRRLCKRIIAVHRSSNYFEVLHAVFHTIRIGRIKGMVDVLLAALPHCDETYLQLPAQRALAATALRSDVPDLKDALESLHPSVRIGAQHALQVVLRKGAVPDLIPMLRDDRPHVRLAVAESLAGLGMRECLPTLVGLLESHDGRVRYRAAAILRALTGKWFGFVSYADPKERTRVVAVWKEFVDKQGGRIALRLPLSIQKEFLGRTLVCRINTKRLEEYDAKGKLTFQSGPLQTPWGCEGLPNGHRLVAVFSARIVVEYNNKGVEVWRSQGLPGQPMSVQRLENGNTLISCSDSGKVIEVSLNKRIVWSITLPGRPIDARRLENGRTLVALYQGRRIVEVGPTGTILWQLRGPGTPSTVQRLKKGHTLVAGLQQHGAVTEYNRAGRIVWTLKGLGTVYEAQRLSNGRTLVATAGGIAEYDRAGRKVWQKNVGPCRVTRY